MQMKTKTNKMISLGVLSAMAASTLGGLGMTPAHAGSKSKRNLAIGLGAVTAYGIVKKKRTLAIGAGLGTAYAYSRYRKEKKQEARNRNARRYNGSRRYRNARRY